MRNLFNIPYDEEFRNAMVNITAISQNTTKENVESQLILIDYNVVVLKERIKLLLKELEQVT